MAPTKKILNYLKEESKKELENKIRVRDHNVATYYKKAFLELLMTKSEITYEQGNKIIDQLRNNSTDEEGFFVGKEFLRLIDNFSITEGLTFYSNDVVGLAHKKIKEEHPHLIRSKEDEEEIQKLDNISSEVVDYLLRKDRGNATEKMVSYIKEKHIIKSTRGDDFCEMWIYEDGIYIPEAKTYIQEIIRKILGQHHTTQILNQVINKIQSDTFIDKDEFFNSQNDTPELIPVKNGILNIYTGNLKDFSPKIPFFNKLEMNYDPAAKCPNIEKFIGEILPKDRGDLFKTIQELFGYSLLKEYKYEKSFMFEGKGRNGKGKLLSLLQRLVGYRNSTSVSLQALENEDSFVISKLHNKLINISGDLSKQAIENTGRFKELTGRDTITANRKYKDHIDFVNYAKMIFSSNELPPINDLSDGFWLRWVLIPFPYQFLPEKEINIIPKEKRGFVKLQDPEILDKIVDKKELEGLLVWSLEGLKRLTKNKDFSFNEKMNEVKNIWLRKSNSVAAFIQDYVIEDYDRKIIKQEFKREYVNYCRKHNLKPLSDKVIKITLENQTSATSNKTRCDIEVMGKEFVWVWDGIKFKD